MNISFLHLSLITFQPHHWELQKDVEADRNTLRIVAFSFPAETQNHPSKTMMPVSLTVGLLENSDMWFRIQVRIPSPLGFVR